LLLRTICLLLQLVVPLLERCGAYAGLALLLGIPGSAEAAQPHADSRLVAGLHFLDIGACEPRGKDRPDADLSGERGLSQGLMLLAVAQKLLLRVNRVVLLPDFHCVRPGETGLEHGLSRAVDPRIGIAVCKGGGRSGNVLVLEVLVLEALVLLLHFLHVGSGVTRLEHDARV